MVNMSLSAGFPYMSRGAGFLQMGLTPFITISRGPLCWERARCKETKLESLIFWAIEKLDLSTSSHLGSPRSKLIWKHLALVHKKIWQYWVTVSHTKKKHQNISFRRTNHNPPNFSPCLCGFFGNKNRGDFVELLDFQLQFFSVILGPENPPFFPPKKKHQFSTFQEGLFEDTGQKLSKIKSCQGDQPTRIFWRILRHGLQTYTFRWKNRDVPGDLKWPFYSLVRGHLIFKRVT